MTQTIKEFSFHCLIKEPGITEGQSSIRTLIYIHNIIIIFKARKRPLFKEYLLNYLVKGATMYITGKFTDFWSTETIQKLVVKPMKMFIIFDCLKKEITLKYLHREMKWL